MSNPTQRARIARMEVYPLTPVARAVYNAWGSLFSRPIVAEVMLVDGKVAATRLFTSIPKKGEL
jgi:hypothetical protein